MKSLNYDYHFFNRLKQIRVVIAALIRFTLFWIYQISIMMKVIASGEYITAVHYSFC